MNKKQLTGFSLLELLLVIGVMIIGLLASYGRFQSYRQQQELMVVKENIATLKYQLQQVYAKKDLKLKYECNPLYALADEDVTKDVVTTLVANLLQTTKLVADTNQYEAYILKSVVIPGYVGSLSNECSQTHPEFTNKMRITVTLNSNIVQVGEVAWYREKLGATSSDSSKLTLMWDWTPTISIPKIGGSLWIMSADLEMFKHQVEAVS